MITDKDKEIHLRLILPNSFFHLQQMLVDAATCKSSIGKKTLFGKDKLQPAVKKLQGTIALCIKGLYQDGHIKSSPPDWEESLDKLEWATGLLESTYPNWLDSYSVIYAWIEGSRSDDS